MERPNVGVVGCGYWGKNLVRNFHALGTLAVICEPDTGQAEVAAGLAPDVPITGSFEDLLREGPPALVIATPAATHYDLVARALEAGKDVFVEKPLALTWSEGAELVRLADEAGRILMVGHVLEYHPSFLALERLVREGNLGMVQYVYSNRLNLGKIRREENILWSFAPHDIALILRLMRDLPFQVAATGGAYVQPNIPDTTITNLLFDNGVRAHVYVSWLHPFKEQRLVVVGSRRMAVFDDVAKQLLLYDQRVEIDEGEPIPVKAEPEPVEVEEAEPLRRECEAFLDAVETRRPPATDGRSGLQVLRVLQAAQRSLVMNGEVVSLPFTEDRPGLIARQGAEAR